MSTTIASSLNNRIVSFVSAVDNDYHCVICLNVADNPTRCSNLCAGVFCDGCFRRALAAKKPKNCPACNKRTKVNPIDVLTKKNIMKNEVYCINKGNDQSDNIDQTDSRKRKASPDESKCSDDDKCSWTGKYNQLAAHLKLCDFEILKCTNDGCAEKLMRRELQAHLQTCAYRSESCKTCNVKVLSSAMTEHLSKNCALAEVTCKVPGCKAKMLRKDYEKHQDESAKTHVQLLSAALDDHAQLLSTALEKKQENTMQVKWRITDIAAKLLAAADNTKSYDSPRFDVFFRGSHKLYMRAKIQGKRLELSLFKDGPMSDDKNRLDIGGTSFTVTKAGLPDLKCTFPAEKFLEPPAWNGWGCLKFLEDMTSYVDDDGINVTIDLHLQKENEPLVL